MRNLYPFKFFVAVIVCSLLGSGAYGQLDSCNAFLQGRYLEVGINTTGAFGSSVSAPAGYHPKGGSSVGNTCYPSYCVPGGTNLGFVADPAKDGWTVGSPAYFGDYFLPGSPQEGWSFQTGTHRFDAWNGSSSCGGQPFGYSDPTVTVQTGFGNATYSSIASKRLAIWKGVFDSIRITQETILDTSKVFFTSYIMIENLSSVTKRDIYYLRTVDPDNDEPEAGGGFTTTNTIVDQLPNDSHSTLISATGATGAYLGLGTLDCRAKCFIINTGLDPQPASDTVGISHGVLNHGLNDMYNGDPTYYKYSGTNTSDQGIGLVFKLDSLVAGGCTSFAYAYILRAADLQAAFASTAPNWSTFGDTSAYLSGDTAAVCKNSIVNMTIVNGGCHSWYWTSSTGNYIYPSYGTTVSVQMDSTPAKLRAIGSNGSCIPDTVDMTIIPNIVITPIVEHIYYCKGNAGGPITAKAPAGTTLRWYMSMDPADTGSAIAPTPNTDSIGTYTYYVAAVSPKCTSERVPVEVTVNPLPPTLVAGNGGMACLGEAAQLTATTINRSQYYWRGPNGFTSNTQNPTVNNVVALDSGMYIVVDSLYGCPTQVDSTLLWVNNLFAKVKTNKPSACIGDTLTLDFGGAAPGNDSSLFQWGFDNGTLISGDPTGTSRGVYVVRWDTAGNKYVTLMAKNLRCVSRIVDTIPVVFAPQVAFSMPKDICINDTVTLRVADYSLTNANKFMWTYGGGREVSNGTTSSGIDYMTFNSIGTKIVTLSIAYPQCIRSPFADTVQVHPYATAHATASRTDICAGDSIIFTADTFSKYRYMWSPMQYFRSYQGGNTSSVAIGDVLATGNIYLTVRDQYNCIGRDSIMINTQPCCDVFLPNAFTPNGDGRNDVFRIMTVGHHPLKVFEITDRYGEIVFRSNVETEGWDGKLHGVPQNAGTYFYYLNYTCNGKTIEKKGDVILVR
jgi:gliding motility-associated-like protein